MLVVCTVQNIKLATEITTLGEQLSETELEVAHELHACRMPASWRQLCGEQLAPPPSYALSSFLGDLYARSQHLEKMLTLVRGSALHFFLFLLRSLLPLLLQHTGGCLYSYNVY